MDNIKRNKSCDDRMVAYLAQVAARPANYHSLPAQSCRVQTPASLNLIQNGKLGTGFGVVRRIRNDAGLFPSSGCRKKTSGHRSWTHPEISERAV